MARKKAPGTRHMTTRKRKRERTERQLLNAMEREAIKQISRARRMPAIVRSSV